MTVEPVTDPCPCYKCAGEIIAYDEFGSFVKNNLHGRLRPCEECGRPKTEHVDLGTKGYFECWWCSERAADPGQLEAGV